MSGRVGDKVLVVANTGVRDAGWVGTVTEVGATYVEVDGDFVFSHSKVVVIAQSQGTDGGGT